MGLPGRPVAALGHNALVAKNETPALPTASGSWPEPRLRALQVEEIYRFAPSATGFSYFGALVTLIGCYNGLGTEGGTEGLGRSTTDTVVQVAMAVIISDFFLTKLFFILFW